MLQRPGRTETMIKGICAAVALTLIYLTVRHPDRREQRNMTAYLILTIGSLMFWSLYQMAPSGLMLFAVNNVNLMVGSVKIQPQWIQNINTVCIVLGGPLLASLFTRMRARGWRIDIPKQFATSLLLMALGFLILPLGIKLAGVDGKSAFVWLFLSYVLQSIGELLISPIGYAMIGKLAPKQYQGVMMGSWMLVTGLASLFAGDFSGMIPEPTGTTAVATNPEYAKLFAELGVGSLAVGIALVVLIPFLRKLITDKAETPLVEAGYRRSRRLKTRHELWRRNAARLSSTDFSPPAFVELWRGEQRSPAFVKTTAWQAEITKLFPVSGLKVAVASHPLQPISEFYFRSPCPSWSLWLNSRINDRAPKGRNKVGVWWPPHKLRVALLKTRVVLPRGAGARMKAGEVYQKV